MAQQNIYADLVEDLLRDRDVRRLVLHDHPGVETGVVEHTVGPHTLVADRQPHLVGQ